MLRVVCLIVFGFGIVAVICLCVGFLVCCFGGLGFLWLLGLFACIGGLCRFGFVFWLFGFGRRLVVALWQVVGGVVSVCRCLLLVGWCLWCLDSRLRIGCLWISVGFGGLWGLFCGWLVT